MTNDVPNAEEFAPGEQDKGGYKKIARKYCFKKGAPSPHPTGRPRKIRNDLRAAFEQRLKETIPVPGKKRARLSRLQFLIRHLVGSAAKGDSKALTEVIRMLEARIGEEAPTEPYWLVIPYEDARFAGLTIDYTEEFYRQNEKDVAAWKKELKSNPVSIKGMLQKELARKVEAASDTGERKKVSLQDIIVDRFIAQTRDEPAALRLLIKIYPEKKFDRKKHRIEYLRPTAEDIEEDRDLFEKEGINPPSPAKPRARDQQTDGKV